MGGANAAGFKPGAMQNGSGLLGSSVETAAANLFAKTRATGSRYLRPDIVTPHMIRSGASVDSRCGFPVRATTSSVRSDCATKVFYRDGHAIADLHRLSCAVGEIYDALFPDRPATISLSSEPSKRHRMGVHAGPRWSAPTGCCAIRSLAQRRHEVSTPHDEFDIAPLMAAKSICGFWNSAAPGFCRLIGPSAPLNCSGTASGAMSAATIDVMIGCASFPGTDPKLRDGVVVSSAYYASAPEEWRCSADACYVDGPDARQWVDAKAALSPAAVDQGLSAYRRFHW